jgi:hypothetical protein
MIQMKPLKLHEDKLSEIANYLIDKLDLTVKARANQVDNKYKQWQDNYSAMPKEKERTTPFPGASNFVPQLIRMHTDILSARICGIMFATRPFWKPRYWFKDLPHESMDALSEWLEYISFSDIEFFEPIDSTIFQTVKNGTCLLKAPWVESSFVSMNGQGQPIINERSSVKFYPVSFDDFFPYPITSTSLCNTLVDYHHLRFAKEEVEWRRTNGLWFEEAAKRLLATPSDVKQEPKRESEAVDAGIVLTEDVSRPFSAIEAWFDYPLDGEQNYKLIFTFNPKVRGKDSILRALYNYYPDGSEPFIDFRFAARDNLFYGYSIPEILEQSQEEQAQIHNARRDANMIANVPTFKKRSMANVPDPRGNWYPGKVFELDAMDDLEALQFGGNYNPMMEEEQFLLQLSERYTGIGTPMQGMGAGSMDGKRGVYSSQGTMALLAEGNKRLDIFLRRLRFPFHRVGNLVFTSYKEFKPNAPEIDAIGASRSEHLKKVFALQPPQGQRYNIFFDIGCSDSGANRELDRQNLLLMSNTMASYYRQIVESATMLSQIPDGHPLRDLLLTVLDGAKDLADRLLFVFDIGDRKRILPDVREVLSGGQGRPGATQPPGVPESEEGVDVGGLQDLSARLSPIAGRGAVNA